MEIFIFGVILVALMVYVSTKIKKVAAAAFERETIEAEDFTLSKPKGFIHPLNENSAFAFEAYTKDFGTDEAKDFRQARAKLRVISALSFDAVCKHAKQSADVIKSKNFSENASQGQRIFLLEISVLQEHRIKFADEIAEMIESFAVK